MTTYPRTDLEDDRQWVDFLQVNLDAFREVWATHYEDGWGGRFPSLRVVPIQGENGPEMVPKPGYEEIDARMVRMFLAFSSGRYEAAQAAYDDLDEAANTVNDPVHGHLGNLHNYISGNWHGPAANDFADRLGDMQQACENMNEVLASARMTMDAYKEMLVNCRDNITFLIEDTQTRLEVAAETEQKRHLNMIKTVIDIAKPGGQMVDLTRPGASPDPGKSLFGALFGVSTVLMQGELSDQMLALGAEYRAEVIYSMVTEGEKIVADAQEAARKIERGFYEMRSYVIDSDKIEFDQISPDRPDIVTDDRFNPDSFYDIEQPEEAYDQVDRDDLVPEPSHKDRIR